MAQSGQTTVTTAGTEVRLATDQKCYWVLIKALAANTGKMYVGNDGSDAVSSSTGYELSAGAPPVFYDWQGKQGNLNQFWLDSTVNGEGVCWMCG